VTDQAGADEEVGALAWVPWFSCRVMAAVRRRLAEARDDANRQIKHLWDVLFVIASHVDGYGIAYLTRETIAKEAGGISTKTVDRSVTVLEQMHLFRVVRRHRRANEFHMLWPPDWPSPDQVRWRAPPGLGDSQSPKEPGSPSSRGLGDSQSLKQVARETGSPSSTTLGDSQSPKQPVRETGSLPNDVVAAAVLVDDDEIISSSNIGATGSHPRELIEKARRELERIGFEPARETAEKDAELALLAVARVRRRQHFRQTPAHYVAWILANPGKLFVHDQGHWVDRSAYSPRPQAARKLATSQAVASLDRVGVPASMLSMPREPEARTLDRAAAAQTDYCRRRAKLDALGEAECRDIQETVRRNEPLFAKRQWSDLSGVERYDYLDACFREMERREREGRYFDLPGVQAPVPSGPAAGEAPLPG
jgi:hypothetical protein